MDEATRIGSSRWFVGIVLTTAAAVAQAPAKTAGAHERPALRLIPLVDGMREDAPGKDLARFHETPCGKEAVKVGVDLLRPANPLVAADFQKGRLFYVFYKVTEEAFGDRAWIVQRIKKTERTWARAGAEPETKVTWQVEAFKTMAGELKGADQHFGSFGIRDAVRREIVKEYEIGFGDVPGKATGAAWPFDASKLFHMLQPYGDDASLHDSVQFAHSRRWQLTATLTPDSWSVVSPELGLDLPKKWPDAKVARPEANAASKATVLTPGVGPAGLQIGTSTAADAEQRLGKPLEDLPAGGNHRNVSYAASLTCNFDGDGKLNTVITRATFAGRTTNGIAHGMSRAEVAKKLGAAKDQPADASTWTYPGLRIQFDGFDTVRRLVIGDDCAAPRRRYIAASGGRPHFARSLSVVAGSTGHAGCVPNFCGRPASTRSRSNAQAATGRAAVSFAIAASASACASSTSALVSLSTRIRAAARQSPGAVNFAAACSVCTSARRAVAPAPFAPGSARCAASSSDRRAAAAIVTAAPAAPPRRAASRSSRGCRPQRRSPVAHPAPPVPSARAATPAPLRPR